MNARTQHPGGGNGPRAARRGAAARRLRRRGERKPPHLRNALIALALLMIAGFIAVAAGTAAAGYFAYREFSDAFEDPLEIADAQRGLGTSRIYDLGGPGAGGTLLFEFSDPLLGLRDPVRLHEVSQYMIDATIATEDASFWTNRGVNLRGLARAAWENLGLGGADFLGGSGGSSITQQLVKNVLIPPEERLGRTVTRVRGKLKETILAVRLTEEYSKEQILAWYLNTIFYGNLSYGVGAASERYFGKPPSELTLPEAAMLAGLPQAPSVYNPLINYETAKQRQAAVLDLMARNGFITAFEADRAKLERLQFSTPEFEIVAPHFVFYARDQVIALCEAGRFALPGGLQDCGELMANGGLRITTTVDLELQALAERALRENVDVFEEEYGAGNGAVVALDPETGRIGAMAGSRDFFRDDIDGQVNLATAPQSPGSSIKPLTYLSAFELDPSTWHPGTIIWDVPISTREPDGSLFQPTNFDSKFRGPVTVRAALANSMNVPAFRVVDALGTRQVLETMHRVGITTMHDPLAYGPSITLGGGEVSLLDMAYAYSVLANNGEMRGQPTVLELPPGYRELDPVAILEIRDSFGRVLYRHGPHEARQAAPAGQSYQLTHILSDNPARAPSYGWQNNLILDGGDRPVAAKTGTAGAPGADDLRRDYWTIGYTPQLVVGVWVGNADNSPMHGGSSSRTAGLIWNQVMQEWHEGRPRELFSEPAGMYRAKVYVPDAPPARADGEEEGEARPPLADACKRVVDELFVSGPVAPGIDNDVCVQLEVDTRTLQPATRSTPEQFRRERVLIQPPRIARPGATALEPAALGWLREHRVAYLHPAGDAADGSEVAISAPLNGSAVAGEVAISGRAETPDLIEWRVTVRLLGEIERATLAEGARPRSGGALARWDAGSAQDGVYIIELEAEDAYFGVLFDEVTVRVGGSAGDELELVSP